MKIYNEYFDDLKESIDKYMNYYNNIRPHKSLNYKTPNQVENSYNKEKIEHN